MYAAFCGKGMDAQVCKIGIYLVLVGLEVARPYDHIFCEAIETPS